MNQLSNLTSRYVLSKQMLICVPKHMVNAALFLRARKLETTHLKNKRFSTVWCVYTWSPVPQWEWTHCCYTQCAGCSSQVTLGKGRVTSARYMTPLTCKVHKQADQSMMLEMWIAVTFWGAKPMSGKVHRESTGAGYNLCSLF